MAGQNGATQSCYVHRGLGAKPMSLGDFLIFREKYLAYFNAIWITFRTFSKLFEEFNCYDLEASKKIKVPSPFRPYFTYRSILKTLLGLTFLSDLATGC